jgi:hypothetical protein
MALRRAFAALIGESAKCFRFFDGKLHEALVVQLGAVTEDLNRRWYEANTGKVLVDIQRRIRHPVLRWMAAKRTGNFAQDPKSTRNRHPPGDRHRSSGRRC